MGKETQSSSLQPGTKLRSKDRVYEIIRILGAGSFGITYLAKGKVSVGNIEITMKFAIKEHFLSASCYRGEDGAEVKTVPTAKREVDDSRADFLTEANRLKEMCKKSRNIVSVNETFEANGTAYYVMEFLDGGNPSKCSEKEAVDIIVQIASALKEIHSENVLHLDLKPDNIVLKTDEKGETFPVLIDFGISKHFDSKGNPTSSLNAKGASPGYAPQEQYAGVTEFSPKYDIYALGAVLYYLTVGKNPPDAFKISPNQQELKKELEGKVSPNVEKTILHAMRPNASERTSTIDEFIRDLRGEEFTPFLNPEESRIEFSKEKGNQNITVKSNIGWNVFSDAEWCKVVKNGNSLSIAVLKNKEKNSRTCNISLTSPSYNIIKNINVKQNGGGTEVFRKRPSFWERNKTKAYIAGGILILAGCVVGIVFIAKSCDRSESRVYVEEPKNEIDSLQTQAVDQTVVAETTGKKPVIPADFVFMEPDDFVYNWWDDNTDRDRKTTINMSPFYISKYELIQKDFKDVMGYLNKENVTYGVGEYGLDPYKPIEGDSIPVKASLKEIAEYCNKISERDGYKGFYKIEGENVVLDREGNGYRIPTEFEWLYAAHGGNLHEKFKYAGSNSVGEVAWYGGNSGNKPHPVGQKKPNGKGLYDMTGNVDEYLWARSIEGYWYPHPYMSYCLWVGTIDEIVWSGENLGARIILVTEANSNVDKEKPNVPDKMKSV